MMDGNFKKISATSLIFCLSTNLGDGSSHITSLQKTTNCYLAELVIFIAQSHVGNLK